MFPDENLQPADFLRQEGDIGYFQTPDGSHVSVDLRQSPYARQIAAQALVERSAQGQALDVPSQPLAPTGARTAPAIPSGIATTAPAIPAASRPMTAPAAPDWSPVEIDGVADSPAARREEVYRRFIGSIYQRDAEAISQGLPTMQERRDDIGRRILRLPPAPRTSSEIVPFTPSSEPPAVVQPSRYAQDMPWRASMTQPDEMPTPPAAPPTQTPDELRRQYALTQMMPAFQGPQPPQPAPPPRFIGTPTPYDIAGMSQAFAQPTPTPEQFQQMTAPPAPAAPVGAPSAQAQPSGQPLRVRAPQPSPDALMVPQGYSPGLIDELAGGTPGSRSMDRREALIGRETELLAQRADAAAAAAGAERDAIDASASRALEIERDRRSAMSDAQQRFQRSVDALGAMREDPARLLRSAAGGVSAAIAIGLGAAGAALAGGGENTALAIVQRNIDRDIAAQRTDIQTAGTAAEAQRSVLGLMRQEFSDQTAAETAARSAMLSAAAAQAQRVTAGLDNRTAQLRGDQMVQQLRDESAAAAAQAQAQEAEAQLQRRLLEARVQRAELANIGTARRLQGGPGRPRATTAPQARVYNATFDSLDPSIPDAERRRIASEASGIPMSVAGALAGGRFAEGAAEETPRAVTGTAMETYNRLRSSGVGHQQALASAGMPTTLPEPAGGSFAATPSAETAARVAAAEAALATLRSYLPRDRDGNVITDADVPGIGTVAGQMGATTLSRLGQDQASAVRQFADNLAVEMTYLRSGAGARDEEVGATARSFGLHAGATQEEFRRGIRMAEAEIRAYRNAAARGSTSEPVGAALTGSVTGLQRVR